MLCLLCGRLFGVYCLWFACFVGFMIWYFCLLIGILLWVVIELAVVCFLCLIRLAVYVCYNYFFVLWIADRLICVILLGITIVTLGGVGLAVSFIGVFCFYLIRVVGYLVVLASVMCCLLLCAEVYSCMFISFMVFIDFAGVWLWYLLLLEVCLVELFVVCFVACVL